MLLHKKVKPGKIWHHDAGQPFDLWMLTWNTQRPLAGKFRIHVRIKTSTWSPFLLYAEWGASSQSSFRGNCPSTGVALYQDTVQMEAGKPAVAFQVLVESVEGAPSDASLDLFVSTSNSTQPELQTVDSLPSTRTAPVAGLSQVALQHPQSMRICSPVSTTAVIRYLRWNDLDPLHFAARVLDTNWNIYGNWVLNCAQAYEELDGAWNCWAQNLDGFADAHAYLLREIPLVVSVKGPLSGSAQPYESGHLIVLCGYDQAAAEVVCMDPAFPHHDQTIVRYALSDFLEAWQRRGRLAYLFAPIEFPLRDTPKSTKISLNL